MENLFDLALDLQKGRYRPSHSVCFIARSPKLREIFAADFLGYIVRPDYRLVRKRVVNNLKYALAQTRGEMISECALTDLNRRARPNKAFRRE